MPEPPAGPDRRARRRDRPDRRRVRAAARRAVGPSLVAMAAWGLVTGLAMVQVGVAWVPALALTFGVYSGTSQLAVLPMLHTGAAVPAMLLAAAVANLRFVVYSAVLSRHLRRLPLPQRLATGYVTIDAPLAALMERLHQGSRTHRVTFLQAANGLTYAVWCGASVLGVAAAAVLPPGHDWAYIGVLALFAMAVPLVRGRAAWAAALVASASAVALVRVPGHLGTVLAVLAGVAAALWILRREAAQ